MKRKVLKVFVFFFSFSSLLLMAKDFMGSKYFVFMMFFGFIFKQFFVLLRLKQIVNYDNPAETFTFIRKHTATKINLLVSTYFVLKLFSSELAVLLKEKKK